MKTYIFIRHGDLVLDSNDRPTDNLTKRAIQYSYDLIKILDENGFHKINKIYYDNSGNSKRCHDTIVNLQGNKIGFNKTIYLRHATQDYEEETHIICYRLESLECILPQFGFETQDIENAKGKLPIINKLSTRPDFLYEYIFVVRQVDVKWTILEWIKTQTYKGDK